MEYLVRRARLTPELQGNWNGPAWRDAMVAPIAHFHAKSSMHRPQAEVKVLYDDRGLYMIFRVRDRYVICRHTQPQAPVCRDSCVEAFLEPKPGHGYFNFEINCGGAILLYFITDSRRVGGVLQGFRPVEAALLATIRIFHSLPRQITEEIDGPIEWTVECSVPNEVFAAHVGALGAPGERRWRGNFHKCADESSHPHWASWAGIGAALNFHTPEYFGDLHFEAIVPPVETKIDVQAEQTPRGLIVRITGDASVDQIEELDRQLHVLTALGPKVVVIDLSAMPHISSMGIGSLLRFRNDIAQAGGSVAVAALRPQVAESFRLGNIERMLPMHASIDDALAT